MFNFIRRKYKKETPEEVKNRVLSLAKDEDHGLCPPSMNAQVALRELCEHLLGPDWYSVMPLCQEQINTEIVYEIETKYPRVKSYWNE